MLAYRFFTMIIKGTELNEIILRLFGRLLLKTKSLNPHRQVGKTTLALAIARLVDNETLYLDLELAYGLTTVLEPFWNTIGFSGIAIFDSLAWSE